MSRTQHARKPGRMKKPVRTRLLDQASDTSHGCWHVKLRTRGTEIECAECGKRWCPRG